MSLELIVNFRELRAAAQDMNNALALYNDAKDEVKAAAEQLAGCWEGDSKVAFVNDQAEAYNWYIDLSEVVAEIISEAIACAQRYEDRWERLKNAMY